MTVMKRTLRGILAYGLMTVFGCSIGNTNGLPKDKDGNQYNDFELKELTGTKFIADYTVSKEDVIRAIPQKYIDRARNYLHVAYQHTSHGTHVTYGLYGLPDYKPGDKKLFAVTCNDPKYGQLDIRDNILEKYAPFMVKAYDLSRDETAFIQTTRNFLDDPNNAIINVVMWSWCNIRDHNVKGNYLRGMKTLIEEYGIGGTKIGVGAGQRANPVYFVFMTGHANDTGNLGIGNPSAQAAFINKFCKENKLLCLDYYSIDTHCMDDNYWDDAGDDGNSYKYNNSKTEEGFFYHDWQNAHELGKDYYHNKTSPGGAVKCGDHTTQHITANRKAYAMWWILARISGWDGESSE
jgi:hypothetical protein